MSSTTKRLLNFYPIQFGHEACALHRMGPHKPITISSITFYLARALFTGPGRRHKLSLQTLGFLMTPTTAFCDSARSRIRTLGPIVGLSLWAKKQSTSQRLELLMLPQYLFKPKQQSVQDIMTLMQLINNLNNMSLS